MFLPNRKTGIVIFTSGPDIDNRLIQEVVSVLLSKSRLPKYHSMNGLLAEKKWFEMIFGLW